MGTSNGCNLDIDEDGSSYKAVTGPHNLPISISQRMNATVSYDPTISTGETPAERVKTPTDLSPGSPRQRYEERLQSVDRMPWKFERKRRSKNLRRKVRKLDQHFGKHFPEKGYGLLDDKNSKSNLQSQATCSQSRNGNRGGNTQSDGSLLVKEMNARSYREWLVSRSARANILEKYPHGSQNLLLDVPAKLDHMVQGGSSVSVANASVGVENLAAENCSSRPQKRQRLIFDSNQKHCYWPNAKPGHDLEGSSLLFEFVEYWVPVQLSNVQIEQYCEMLLSNSIVLCSHSKDPMNYLNDIIITARKCCDHPYLLNQSLRDIVRKDLPVEEYLDADIRLSGKLLFLDKILMEIRKQGLRALIIFQSIGGSGKLSVGDILEDLVSLRFGKDCYVRIDGVGGVYARSKKQAALDMFNDKDGGKFISLIENRACLSSIKLLSVGTVILFDSDWDPQNDLRALRRITITSRFEQLKLFRLYSCFTVEEMVLVLAKEGVALDNNISSVNHSVCQDLLNWGVFDLFRKLGNFHDSKTSVPGSNIFSEYLFLDDVLKEFSSQLLVSGEDSNSTDCSFISKVKFAEGAYARDNSLIGEKETTVKNSQLSFFWKDLKERRPQWHFLSESSSRVRRKAQYLDNLPEEPPLETCATREDKVMIAGNQTHLKSRLKHKNRLCIADKGHLTDRTCSNHEDDFSVLHPVNDAKRVNEIEVIKCDKGKIPSSLWKKDLSSLKPEILQLCDILEVPDNVKVIAVRFVEFILKDYDVSWKTNSTLLAFQISLCWTAASLLKHNIGRMESLIVARQHLKLYCMEEEACYIYSKLQKIKQRFVLYLDNLQVLKKSKCSVHSKSPSSNKEDMEVEVILRVKDAQNSESSTSGQLNLEGGKLLLSSLSQSSPNQPTDLEKGMKQLKDSELISSEWQEAGGEIPTASSSVGLEEVEIPIAGSLADFEGETLYAGSLRNLEGGEMPTAGSLGNLQEREIPSGCQLPNLLGPLVSVTMQQKPLSETAGSLRYSEGEILNALRDLEEKEILAAGPSVRLEEGEILPAASLGELEERDKPSSQQSPALVDQQPLTAMQQKPECRMLTDNLLEQLEDTNSEKKLHFKNVTTLLEQQCAGIEPITIDSDTESVGTETNRTIVSTADPASSTRQNDEVRSCIHSIVDSVTVPFPTIMQSVENNTYFSATEPLRAPQTDLNEVVIIGIPEESFSPCMPAQKDSVSLQTTETSEVRPDREMVTLDDEGSANLPLSGISCSVAQQDNGTFRQGEILLPPLWLSALPCFSGQTQDGTGTSTLTEIQGGRHASGQQAQVARQLQESVELRNATAIDMSLPASTSTLGGRNETHAHYVRGRTSVQDLYSTATLTSENDHLLDNSTLMPAISRASCSRSSVSLQNEMDRVCMEKERLLKIHETKIAHIKSLRDKEIEEVFKKYDILLKEAETARIQKLFEHKIKCRKILLSKLVAELLTLKDSNYGLAGAQGNLINKLLQLFIQQNSYLSAQGLEEASLSSRLVASITEVNNHSPSSLSNGYVGPYSSFVTFSPRSRSRSNWQPLMHSQPFLWQLQGSHISYYVPEGGDSMPLYRDRLLSD